MNGELGQGRAGDNDAYGQRKRGKKVFAARQKNVASRGCGSLVLLVTFYGHQRSGVTGVIAIRRPTARAPMAGGQHRDGERAAKIRKIRLSADANGPALVESIRFGNDQAQP